MNKLPLVSIIVPCYNEESNLRPFYQAIRPVLKKLPYNFELIFVDDGSTDGSLNVIRLLALKDRRVQIIELVRNFGKEIATTAGLHECQGDMAIMIDADLQHPVELIGEFIKRWEDGAEVVVGVRSNNNHDRRLRRWSSALFYRILSAISETQITPNATDYRLVDRVVINQFNRFTERNRLTRGLIDWLGFSHDHIAFTAQPRRAGEAGYSWRKLMGLAVRSFIGHSLLPLKLAGYLGLVITLISAPLGLFIFVERYLLHDPLGLHFSGPAILGVLILFLVGIILICLGLIALYVGNIHSEVVNRPLYLVRHRHR